MEREYKDYYEDCLNKGLEYQDFIATVLLKELGIPLSSLNSKKYQYEVGENLQGIEKEGIQSKIDNYQSEINKIKKKFPDNFFEELN